MLDLVSKKLLENSGSSNNEFSCCIENTTGNVLIVDVRGNGSFTVQIKALEYGATEYHQIALTDISTLSTVTNITSAGIYTASAVGIHRVIAVPKDVSQSVTVIAKFGTNDTNGREGC